MKYRSTVLRYIGLSLMSLLLVISSALHAADDKNVKALVTVTEQRTLSQQMLKSYMLVVLKVRVRNSKKELAASAGRFEELTGVLTASLPESSRNSGKAVSATWQKLKPLYASLNTKGDSVDNIYKLSEQLLGELDQLTAELDSTVNDGFLINLSARQEMISQRLAALYNMMYWGYYSDYRDNYNAMLASFEEAMVILKDRQDNTPGITKGLFDVESQFRRFKAASDISTGTYVPAMIVRSADKISKRMNEVTEQYQNIAAN